MRSLTIRASQSNRAFNCFGSVQMESNAPSVPDSDDAKEGTAAHWLAEMVLTGQVSYAGELVDRQAPNGVMITGEMVDHTMMYINHVRSRGLPLHIEQPTSIRLHNEPDFNVEGISDCTAIDTINRILYIDDLKYGYRLVEADFNYQLINYGLGLGPEFTGKADTFVFTIIQPRPRHPSGKIRSWTITREQLSESYREMESRVFSIYTGDTLQTGSHCLYCDAYTQCPAAQAAGMNAIDVSSKAFTDVLTGPELNSELINLNRASQMIKHRLTAYEELATSRLMSSELVPGWAIDDRYGNKEWTVDIKMVESMSGKKLTVEKDMTPAAALREGVDEATVDAFTTNPYRGKKLVKFDPNQFMRKVLKS